MNLFQVRQLQGDYWGVWLRDKYLMTSPLDKYKDAENLCYEFNKVAEEYSKWLESDTY